MADISKLILPDGAEYEIKDAVARQGVPGGGDMLKSTYDTNNNGIVDDAEKVNGHTVESDVPANAVFTDTTYSTVTTSTNGLMSASDKTKLNGITDSADSVSFTRNLSSGTQIGSITINGSTTAIYAPSSSGDYLPLSGGTMTGTIVTPGHDSFGIEPATNNYGRIGDTSKYYYNSYITNMYGSNVITQNTVRPSSTNSANVGTSSYRYNTGYINNLYTNTITIGNYLIENVFAKKDPFYHFDSLGPILAYNNNIASGYGSASVYMFDNGFGFVVFSAKFDDAISTDSYTHGLSISRIVAQTTSTAPSASYFTPLTGGFAVIMDKNTGNIIPSYFGYGECVQAMTYNNSYKYWSPARIYSLHKDIGAWGTKTCATTMWFGVAPFSHTYEQ